MPRTASTVRFLAVNVCVWLAMVAILVVVPDWLDRWLAIELSRGIAWAVACAVWVVVIEAEWKARFGVFSRSVLQLVLWVAAALVAIWISDQVNLRTGI